MEIFVKSCLECPFSNKDNEFGRDGCNIKFITLLGFEEMPSNKRHEECPLNNEKYEVKAYY